MRYWKKPLFKFGRSYILVSILKSFNIPTLPIIFILICLLLPIQQIKADESISSFLRIGVDARGVAMGEAQGALTSDVYSMYWNPAGLSKILFKELGVTYNRIFQGLNYSFIGYATPTNKYGTIAGQIFFLDSGPITTTYENIDGSFGGVGDSFSVMDIGLGVSQSLEITNDISYGVSVKLLSHKIMSEQAFSVAGDIGIMYEPLIEELCLGATLQNVSTNYSFLSQNTREPWNLRLACLYEPLKIPLSLTTDYNIVAGQRDTLNFGAEYLLFDIIAFRAGMKLRPPSGLLSSFSTGIGINIRDVYEFDYSLSPNSRLGLSQRFSIIARF